VFFLFPVFERPAFQTAQFCIFVSLRERVSLLLLFSVISKPAFIQIKHFLYLI